MDVCVSTQCILHSLQNVMEFTTTVNDTSQRTQRVTNYKLVLQYMSRATRSTAQSHLNAIQNKKTKRLRPRALYILDTKTYYVILISRLSQHWILLKASTRLARVSACNPSHTHTHYVYIVNHIDYHNTPKFKRTTWIGMQSCFSWVLLHQVCAYQQKQPLPMLCTDQPSLSHTECSYILASSSICLVHVCM